MTARARRLPPAVVVTMLALAAGLAPSSASANGRFPRAERLVEDPANPDRLLLAATYGLLTTHDRGRTWYYTCEAAFAGLAAYSGDPLIDLVAGGAALVNAQYELNRSADDCAWTPTLGTDVLMGHEIIEDFSVDHAQRQIVVALVASFVGASTEIRVKQSVDRGLSWAVLGAPLPLSLAYTIDLDPSDPTHLYASGLSADGSPTLATSLDAATTWTTRPIAGADKTDLPYIAAVSPRNGVFVRTNSSVVVANGTSQGNDALFYSGDGGSTWLLLLRKSAKLLGFALSPDGANVIAGYGNDDATTSADPSQLGIFEAKTSDWVFAPVFVGDPVTCLTWTAAGTYACMGQQTAGGFEQLAFFPAGTLAYGGPPPASLLRLGDVAGLPPACSSTTAACDWSSLCSSFDACPDAGSTGRAGEGGGEQPDAMTPADAFEGGAAAPSRPTASSCSCRLSPADTGRRAGPLALATVAVLCIRRRRRLS